MDDYKKYFAKSIKENYPGDSNKIIATVNDYFKIISIDTRFAASSTNPIDKRLDFSSYFLALIKTLDEKGESFDDIRKICLEIVTEYVRPKNKFQQLLKRLPVLMTNTLLAAVIINVFNKRINHNPNPEGFVANIITDKAETYGLGYGFDILECGICKLFAKHNYNEYASILCEVDEITSGFAGLKLIRTGTIANGAKKCDFRFKKA
jgi:hypothetical protein